MTCSPVPTARATRSVPTTSAETTELEIALTQAVMSLGSRSDPLSRAVASGRLLELLGNYIETVSDLRRRAVASAVTLPGMSMGKVADELGIPKSTVAKLAGPASIRQQIASEMRGHLVASGDSPSSDERLQAAFRFGAGEGQRR